jgi:hypothetical protein
MADTTEKMRIGGQTEDAQKRVRIPTKHKQKMNDGSATSPIAHLFCMSKQAIEKNDDQISFPRNWQRESALATVLRVASRLL